MANPPCWNVLKHGLRAETAVLPGEDAEDCSASCRALVEQLRPAGESEAVLVDRIVSLVWRLRRAGHVEAGLLRLVDTWRPGGWRRAQFAFRTLRDGALVKTAWSFADTGETETGKVEQDA